MKKLVIKKETLSWPGKLKWLQTSNRFFVKKDWEDTIVKFLRKAAIVLKKDFDPSKTRTEDNTTTSRDDNGSYYWDGTFIEGDKEQNIELTYCGSQAEEMMYPMPLEEKRTYLVNGLDNREKLELICSYREYAAEVSFIDLTINLEARQRLSKKILDLFQLEFSDNKS